MDVPAICEYLTSESSTTLGLHGHIRTKMFADCSKLQKNVRFFEYNPMINARAHKVGSDTNKNQILNKTFRQTYDRFL